MLAHRKRLSIGSEYEMSGQAEAHSIDISRIGCRFHCARQTLLCRPPRSKIEPNRPFARVNIRLLCFTCCSITHSCTEHCFHTSALLLSTFHRLSSPPSRNKPIRNQFCSNFERTRNSLETSGRTSERLESALEWRSRSRKPIKLELQKRQTAPSYSNLLKLNACCLLLSTARPNYLLLHIYYEN